MSIYTSHLEIGEDTTFTSEDVFLGVSNSGYGGAIFNDQAVVTVDGSTFTDNSASNGGGITNHGRLYVNDAFFTSNRASSQGGAISNNYQEDWKQIFITGSTFASNIAEQGGALVNGATTTILASTSSGTLFTGNTAAYGGAISNRGGLVRIEDAVFEDNFSTSSSYGGGAIFMLNTNCNLNLTNVSFTGNVASNNDGGAIYNGGSSSINGGTFSGNRANNGGAIGNVYMTTIVNALFKDNTATAQGGAITNNISPSNNGFVFVDASTFSGNKAGQGGAFVNAGSFTVKGTTNKSLFTNNVASFGGAICNRYSTVSISQASFIGNTATGGDGGGALFNNTSACTIVISDSDFSQNHADSGFGGVIYNNGGVVTLSDSTFTANTAAQGGVFRGTKLTATGALFADNTAKSAGAILVTSGDAGVTISNSTFTNNSAVITGGAICVLSGGALTVKDSVFSGNKGPYGGAIYSEGTLVIDGGTFATQSDTVRMAVAPTLKGNILLNADLQSTGNGPTTYYADGLNFTFGGTTGVNINGTIVAASGAAVGLQSVTFGNTAVVTFRSQDLTGVDVTILGDVYGVGTYTLANGLTGMGTSADVEIGGTVATKALGTGYLLADTSLVQKTAYADGALAVTTTDTLTISADGDNGFDGFASQASLDATYNGYTGNITGIVSNQSYSLGNLMANTRANLIQFDASQATATLGGSTLTRNLTIEGNGVAATAVTAGAFYAGGKILVLKDLSWTGSVYGGVKDSSVNNVAFELDNVKLSKDIYGAGVAANSALTVEEDVTAVLKDVTGEVSYYGAGFANGGDINVEGEVNTSIIGGSYKNVFSGANLGANAVGKTYALGGAELNISGGEFSGIVGNGGFVRAGQTSTQGDSFLDISGGTFNGTVYGGAFAYGTGSKSTTIEAGTATVAGDIYVAISGGVFNADIFGGSLASNSHIATTNTSITGDILISLDATDNVITLNGSVYAGSLGKGAVTGNTTILVTGDGDNLVFGSDSYLTGTSEYGTTVNSYVSGNKTLVFDGFSGEFNGIIANGAFDTVDLYGESLVWMTNAEFDGVSTWNIDADCILAGNLSADALDLSGDVLNIEGTLEDGDVTVLVSESGLTWDANTAVTLFGEVAAATADGVWESNNYRMTANSGAIAVAVR